MSDNIEDDIVEKALESVGGLGAMGNLQHSINRSLEIAQNSKRTYFPGETRSTNHLIFEMNEFYMKMAQRINTLNLKSDNYADDDDDVEETDGELYAVVSAIRKKRNDPEIKKQIEAILKLDQMMENSINTLKEERMERQRVQKNLCDIIDREDDTCSRSTFFRALCDFENGISNSAPTPNANVQQFEGAAAAEDESQQPHTQDAPRRDNKFIKRNIQLAKNTPTAYTSTSSLTDEEKVRLDHLLLDLDAMEESESVSFGTDSDHLAGLKDTSENRPFALTERDQARMRELESKLERLSEASKPEPAASSSSRARRWRNEDRLRRIDKKLEKLQSARESFTFQPAAGGSGPCAACDATNDAESISYDARSAATLANVSSIVRKDAHEPTEPPKMF